MLRGIESAVELVLILASWAMRHGSRIGILPKVSPLIETTSVYPSSRSSAVTWSNQLLVALLKTQAALIII